MIEIKCDDNEQFYFYVKRIVLMYAKLLTNSESEWRGKCLWRSNDADDLLAEPAEGSEVASRQLEQLGEWVPVESSSPISTSTSFLSQRVFCSLFTSYSRRYFSYTSLQVPAIRPCSPSEWVPQYLYQPLEGSHRQ